jgi:putative methylase
MKKKELEIVLQRVEPFQDPSPGLEQYSTPADIAADLLFTAYSQGDIEGLTVLDLGCGTGILAIGAALLGATRSVGVDKDEGALRQAAHNAARAGASVELIEAEVQEIELRADTVIMNPPFGAQRRHADRPFLEKAMQVSDVIYSLHNASTQDFLLKLVSSCAAHAEIQKRYKFEIPHTFAFHKKAKKDVEVVLLRIQTR